MKVLMIIILALILYSSCMSDFHGNLIKSPSGKYFINATVNRTDSKVNNCADVIIHIYSSDKKELKLINSKAGDANKWALGWTLSGDTIVFQSSDIGNQAWTVVDDKLIELNLNDKLDKRALELYNLKYK